MRCALCAIALIGTIASSQAMAQKTVITPGEIETATVTNRRIGSLPGSVNRVQTMVAQRDTVRSVPLGRPLGHLRGTTVHDWPLNVFSDEDAAAQLSTLRAIASSDLHNLVLRADYRIVPAVTASPATPLRK